MTNDTSTLNGALAELGETMAANLTAKGVTASASDGLTTLAGKILTIPSGGSCYHIEFSEDSYVAVGGTATLEIMLQENYAPKSGATVTITGSDSSLYTGITNSSGIATVTVSVSADTSFTASYSNVSANCSVTVPTYLFYDDCSSASGISQYGNSILLKGTSTNNLTFSTDHYIMSGTNADFSGFAIPNCTGVDNVKVRIKFKLTQTSNGAYNQFGIGVGNVGAVTTNHGLRVRNDKKFQQHDFINSAETEGNVYTHSNYFSTDWFYAELIKQGTSLTIKLYDKNLNQLATNTRTITNYTNPQYIFYNLTVRGTSYATHIQEILVEPL